MAEYVRTALGMTNIMHLDADMCEIDFAAAEAFDGLEMFALGCVRRGEEPVEYWLAHMDEMRASILISDDVSCGIVPIDTTLRAWREANGRANNRLAREAGEVWRVFCGLGHRLK